MCNIIVFMYLLELKSMKGCKALRHHFLFWGIESFSSIPSLFSNKLCVCLCCLWSLSFSFAPFVSLCWLQWVFCAIWLWKKKDGSCKQYIKLKVVACGGTHISVWERERRERWMKWKGSGRCSFSSAVFSSCFSVFIISHQ